MVCCNRLFLLGGTLGLAGFLGLMSPGAIPLAHAAPGGACLASSARDTARFGAAAENALATGRRTNAWRNVHNAVRVARRGGCSAHRSLGRAYLVLGIIEHQSGRYTRMYSAWQKALGLDRTLTLDARFTNARLRAAFNRLRKKLVPAAVARPRPLPRPRPRVQPGPRPRVQPGPSDPTPAPRTPDPPERPVTRAPPEPTPDPYADRPRPRGGCSTDQDCKGSRICDRGRCTYPRYRTPTPAGGSTGGTVHPGTVRRAPVPPLSRKRGYSDKGCVELGLGIGLQYTETTAKYEDDDYTISQLHFDLNLYVGYFVADRFKLGFYFATPITKITIPSQANVLAWEVDLIGAPGFSWPFSPKIFGFVDFLLGFAALGEDYFVSSSVDDNLVMGLVGGELGLKFLLGKHMLLKVGFKPVYLFGKTSTSGGYYSSSDTIKLGELRVIVTMGFSAYW